MKTKKIEIQRKNILNHFVVSWKYEAIAMLKNFCNERKLLNQEFAFEDFRQWALQEGLNRPHHHNAWGALTMRAIKEGMIKWTGNYRNAQSIKTHSHPVKIWRAI